MKIAIHRRKGVSEHWIAYCESKQIPWKPVNCYQSNIIQQLSDCDALMWSFHHENPLDLLFAKQLLYAVQSSGKKVFPDFNTVWHFDDKIGQKYLLESIGAPLVPSYVFYSKTEAIKWLKECKLPLVFKLRSGASSKNVKLIKTEKEGKRIISKAFRSGFKAFYGWSHFINRLRKYMEGLDSLPGVLKGFARIFIPPTIVNSLPKQKGYVYFQEFIPNNNFDVRLIVIGERAYGMKRIVIKNDFRASGSGKFDYDTIEKDTIRVAFEISEKLKIQAVAYDFIYSNNKQPLLIEMSCFFGTTGSSKCPGYWDRNLNWHKGEFNPYGWMVEMVMNNK